MQSLNILTLTGFMLIIVGIVLVALPLIAKYVPSLEKLPWIILWIYKGDGFYFATSPLLIIISAVFIILRVIKSLHTS